MRGLPVAARRIELDDAARRRHRHDRRDAKLGRLLHDEIHALGARDALHERECERRFGARGGGPCDLDFHRVTAETRDPRGIVLAVAIEERQGIACLEAEDPTDVSRGRTFERDAGTCGQRRIDVDADQAHAASTAPLAMPASQSISSGVMT